MPQEAEIAAFIERWRPSEGGERRTYQMFLAELCDCIGVARPETTGEEYCFERPVTFLQWDYRPAPGRIDLYKKGCFIIETKQGVFKPPPLLLQGGLFGSLPIQPKPFKKGHGIRGSKTWDSSMMRAREQAKRYVDALPKTEPPPPFLIIIDIGYSFEIWADFTKSGRYSHSS